MALPEHLKIPTKKVSKDHFNAFIRDFAKPSGDPIEVKTYGLKARRLYYYNGRRPVAFVQHLNRDGSISYHIDHAAK